MIPAETLIELATLGLSRDQAEKISRMLRSVEDATRAEGNAAIDARRANDRDRKARQRLVKSREVTGQDVTERDGAEVTKIAAETDGIYNHARADGIPAVSSLRSETDNTPLPTVGPQGGKKSKPKSVASNVEAILAECFGPETSRELIAHRKAVKAPLTDGAARGLVREVRQWGGDPQAAAREMMVRGWRGFKPEWMHNGTAPRAGPTAPVPRRSSIDLAAERLLAESLGLETNLSNPADAFDGPTLDLGVSEFTHRA